MQTIGKNDHRGIALALQDLIWSTVPVSDSAVQDWAEVDTWLNASLNEASKGHLCLGLTATFQSGLAAFGIPHRHVQMYDSVDPYRNGHNTVEVWLDGQWVAIDPTYGVSFVDTRGRNLSYSEIRDSCLNNAIVFPRQEPRTNPLRKVTFKEYSESVPLCSLTRYLVIGPTHTGQGTTTIPSSWDGRLKYRDGSTFDTRLQLEQGQPWIQFQVD